MKELAVIDDFSVDIFLIEFLAQSYEFDSDVFAWKEVPGKKSNERSWGRDMAEIFRTLLRNKKKHQIW